MKYSTHNDRDCARAWEAMPWVLQDVASEDQDQWLMEHMAQCEDCRAEFAQQSRLRQAMSLPSDVPVDVHAGLRRLMARLDAPQAESLPATRRTGWITRALAAAVVMQAIGIGALGMRLWSEPSAPGNFRTLSDPVVTTQAGAIHVVPETGMTLADWNALLQQQHLQIIAGPNDVGAYTLAPTNGRPADVASLRATKGIRLAEPALTP
ncbi:MULTISPECIES: anti-sigma factor family protein [Dyella]|uniref:Zf-HC2 domain-containing protein n=2 Tax=Dyella TaxID=231454 RepID=A0A4R0YU45_9GAMM|nr:MULTISPECIES: zf-HC2 domain-containing protein [Dyella]TBR39480.1 zf-HC2 domain-containing protein [Dyella terrae]TCI12935.1 zf-HC2 domain-containing protein [Dyella soli]